MSSWFAQLARAWHRLDTDQWDV